MRTTDIPLTHRSSRRWSRFPGVGLVLAGLALIAVVTAACGGPSTPGTSPSPAAPSSAPSSPGQAVGTKVTATLTDFHIALSQQHLTPGTYTFVAMNSGQTTHALSINGPGVNDRTPDIQPGQSANLTVTLGPGTYDVYCPVDNHKELGMNTSITVAAGAGGGGSPIAPAPTTPHGYGY